MAKFLGKQLCNFEACNFIKKGKVAHVFLLILKNSFLHVFFMNIFLHENPGRLLFEIVKYCQHYLAKKESQSIYLLGDGLSFNSSRRSNVWKGKFWQNDDK